MSLAKAIYTSFTGISPVIAENICYEAGFDSSLPANTLEHGNQNIIWMNFYQFINQVKRSSFYPVIYEKDGIRHTLKSDSTYYAVGMKSCDSLYFELAPLGVRLSIVGDCKKVGKVAGAVHSGFFAAMDIGKI